MTGITGYSHAASCLQLLHVAAPGKLYWPLGHSCVSGVVDPAGHMNPALQSPEQAALDKPVVLPYTPPGQAEHTLAPPPPSLYWPTPHSTGVGDPLGQKDPAGQDTAVGE